MRTMNGIWLGPTDFLFLDVRINAVTLVSFLGVFKVSQNDGRREIDSLTSDSRKPIYKI